MTLYDRDLIDALTRNVIGKPASICTWQELLAVRDVVDELLNRAVNVRQLDPASTAPPAASTAMAQQEHGPEGERADPFTAVTSPAPDLPGRHYPRGGGPAAPLTQATSTGRNRP